MGKEKDYGERILDLSREELSCSYPFLAPAIYGLNPLPGSGCGFRYAISRDGDFFLYDPEALIEDFLSGKDTAAFLLHSVLHCLLFHPFFTSRHSDRELWDLASDISVRDIMIRLGRSDTGIREENAMSDLREHLPALNAEGIYSVLKSGSISPELFKVDDHAFWSAAEKTDRERDATESLKRWERIKGEVELSLSRSKRSFRGRGDLAGYFTEILQNVERRQMDYGAFLESFGAYEETVRTDQDSFDFSLYSYGLELYGDMPIIEPPEYSERKTVREFAVAIDTSLSCDMELIRQFLERTYDIFFMSMDSRIKDKMIVFQCDNEIKSETVIRDRDELKRYMSKVAVKGRGGTDFRPVFKRLEELKARELTNLKGLLYFTDGDGVFPEKPPEYKTAFVMPYGSGYKNLPPWVMKTGFLTV